MGQNSKIEWTEATWNPVTGCSHISPGCDHCYAEAMARRLQAMGKFSYRNGFEVTLQPQTLDLPLSWRKPRMVFVNSMSDLFHGLVPDAYIEQVFGVMSQAYWHTFQVLTKRPERLRKIAPRIPCPSNVWIGTTIESGAYRRRADEIRGVPAAVRFLSIEPLLGPLGPMDLSGIHWVIVGGESGPGCRRIELDWVREIRDQCVAHGVAFFLKQLGGYPSKRGGDDAIVDGRLWREMPRCQRNAADCITQPPRY